MRIRSVLCLVAAASLSAGVVFAGPPATPNAGASTVATPPPATTTQSADAGAPKKIVTPTRPLASNSFVGRILSSY